jgi:nucleotide-binding universal stress UspA family protein
MEKQTKKRTRYNNVILIPTDFSEVCENAINHGLELAQFLHYKVCILHVMSKENGSDKKTGNHIQQQVDQNLQRYKELFENKYSVKIDLLVKEGHLLKVINKVATEIKANLMVLGTHGKQGLQHLFGSHALKVVLDSPCPVVVVQKRSFENGYHHIVLPVSSDIEPRQSVDWILLMSKLFNSKIHLFQSMETDSELNSSLNIITRQIIKIFDEKNVPYDINTSEASNDFSSQIISFAAVNQSDMIMIMTMPGENVPGFNFSAWNERLMFNEAQIPVMCVNPIELGEYYNEWMRLT